MRVDQTELSIVVSPLTTRYPTGDPAEPDPFKPATDVSQCTHCGAQISVVWGVGERVFIKRFFSIRNARTSGFFTFKGLLNLFQAPGSNGRSSL